MEVQELLREIFENELVLPEFQREYVWNRDQARGLIESLFKDFPTGSLLLWKTASPPALKNKTIKSEAGSVNVILDGQQRLTTLFLLIKDSIPPYYSTKDIAEDPRNLYFDLLTGKFMYFKSSEMSGKPNWVSVIDCFNKEIKYSEIAKLIKKENDDLASLIEIIVSNRDKLRSILKFKYPIQFVPQNAKLAEAVDIFDKVNSEGTKLTEAELALAHMTSHWPDARREFKKKLNDLRNVGFNFDLDFLTRCITGILTGRARFELTHEIEKERLIEAWERLSKILDYVINILMSKMHIASKHDLNTPNVLVPFVVYIHKKCVDKSAFQIEEKELRKIQKWLYLASIWARYSGQPTQTLDRDLSILNTDNPIDKLISEILMARGRITLTETDLRCKGKLHPLYPMLKVLVIKNGAVDWSNGIPISQTMGLKFRIESHHIFPKSELYSEHYHQEDREHRQIVNEIANRVFLTSDANKGFFDDLPENYLPKVVEKYPGEIEKQYIPTNKELWKSDNFEEFLRERRRLIAIAINEFIEKLSEDEAISESLEEIIKKPENEHLEFKSTLRYSIKGQIVDTAVEKSSLKTICAFLNTDGGKLIIGITDDRIPLGLDNDYNTLNMHNSDGFQTHLLNLIKSRVGEEFFKFIEVSFPKILDKELCVVNVHNSNKPAVYKEGILQEFYQRVGNGSRLIPWPQAIEYIREHWE